MSASALKSILDPIPGYRISATIYQSARVTVYRAERTADQRAVILKVLNPNCQGHENLALHRREYDIVRSLAGKGAIALCDADSAERSPVLAFEDFGGESLRSLSASRVFTLSECLTLGIKTADALASIHAAGVIHKDINPANIVYNPKTSQLKIIDFGLSTSLAREQPLLGSPEVLEGTLAYISPEQTGRMNRSVDYRTDFYSLGATLYELLTGRVPFEETDPLSLVHAHLAKEPDSPTSIDANVPAAVSAIVLKLLAKMAEERYQSALGIKRDLEECLTQLTDTGKIIGFAVARFDACDGLKPSQRLYGRETELEVLLAAYDRAAGGGREIAMVTGYSGIGKTSLVRELYKPITARRGYFISGKFDQLQRNVPYKAIINAFQELTRQLLGENAAKLATWKQKLLTALGANGQIIVDIIPEMELIIGAQPPLVALDPQQEQNRFNLALANFIRVFCKAEHPLTVYLDDLQWIDPASLKLMAYLIGDPSVHHLFFVGAYRDNEVSAAHPLMEVLQSLKQTGVLVHAMTLHPLNGEHVRQMVADTLSMESAQVASLADLITKKTGGNPFFTEEFVKSLYADKLLTFDRAHSTWRWDVSKINAQSSTDNVIDLMVAKLKRLDPETQKVLQLAACIGNQFDLATLAVIYQKPTIETMAALHEAIVAELVIPIGTSLSLAHADAGDGDVRVISRFAHDRIQHAAYSLIPDAQRQAAHLEIGRLLLRELPEEDRQEQLFEIVNHLNVGVQLIAERAEQETLTDLNFEAGRRARRSNAYDAALNYLHAALTLVGERGWEQRYELTLALHTEAAQAALLAQQYAEVETLVERILQRAHTLLDKIDAYGVRIEALIVQSKMREAATLGFAVLKMLGVSFPKRCSRRRIAFEALRLKLLFWGRSKEMLLNAPLMQDPYRLAEMRIIPHVLTASYFATPLHTALVAFRAVRISAHYGNTPFSAFAYASYGSFLCGNAGRMAEGREFGELALALMERLNAVSLKSKVMGLVYGQIFHWTQHLHSVLDSMHAAFRVGMESGDLEFASHNAVNENYSTFYGGLPLSTMESSAKKYQQVLSGTARVWIAIWRQLALNLIGGAEDVCRLAGEACNEDELLPKLQKQKEMAGLLAYHAAKATLAFTFEHYDEALGHTGEVRKYQKWAAGLSSIPPRFFLDALIRLAVYPGLSPDEQKRAMDIIDGNRKRLQQWAEHAPMNNLHRVHLIDAERCRVLGQARQAAEHYDRAIACAKKEEYIFEEALANELAGKFYLGRDRAQFAYGYLREARDVYARWGAMAKVKHLEQRHPLLTQGHGGLAAASDVGATIITGGFSMDLKALMRALKEIGSEQIYSHLLEKTITLAMEVAGAQSALLFLRNERDELFLEAEANVGRDKPEILKSVPLADCKNVSSAVINYVSRTKQTVVVHDAQKPQNAVPSLQHDAYVHERGVKSILCIPLLTGTSESPELSGLLYLENNAASHTFVERVQEPLEIICLSAAGRLELSRKAVTDLLTNLYNHDYMQGILLKEISVAARTGRKLSLIMIDIDHFKKFNDNHGHQAGDLVLSKVADAIKSSTRQSDVVARYGGEEMAVVLPDTDKTVAYEVAERIRHCIEAMIVPFDGKELRVTASLGVAAYGPKTPDAKALVKVADAALYQSKHDGRNRVTVAGVIRAA
jgi:histidine kinase